MSFLEFTDKGVESFLHAPITSGQMPRWERKQNALQQQKLSQTKESISNASSASASASTSETGAHKRATSYGDRFIPCRESNDARLHSYLNYDDENKNPAAATTTADASGKERKDYNRMLAECLGLQSIDRQVLTFKADAPAPSLDHQNRIRELYVNRKSESESASSKASSKATRHINCTSDKILDAPAVVDDYYLNPIDWSSNNLMAVALYNVVYLWNPTTTEIEVLFDMSNEETYPNASQEAGNFVTSVRFMPSGNHIAVGTNNNEVQLWDVSRRARVRVFRGHQGRVSSLAWNKNILSSGSRDSNIFNHDVRVAQHHVSTFKGHEKEVCGLEWNIDGSLLASGSNDNLCCIWDAKNIASSSVSTPSAPTFTLNDSCAAVKALAWAPFQRNLLATGGGAADRQIRFYNTTSGTLMNSIDSKSQVCSLIWSQHEKEILSGHGFSQNQLSVWKYPSLVKLADLQGHTSRVLKVCCSPDGQSVVSIGADETLRFWNVWEPRKKVSKRIGGILKQPNEGARLIPRDIR